MSKPPALSSREVIRAFERVGFTVVREEGSHKVMERPGHRFKLSVPCHKGETVAPGTLRSLIRASGLTPEEFASLL